MIDRTVQLSFACLSCVSLFLVMPVSAVDDKPATQDASFEFFEKEVRPILVARCYECHSGDKKAPKGGLRLDSREALLTGGDTGPAVSLDQPATSLFVSAINYGDLYQMPPKSKLPANEIAVLTKWVESGLAWPKESSSSVGTVKPFDLAARAADHWCWQPVKQYAPPEVKQTNWPVSTADRFILAKLESKGLNPATSADRRTLLRRIYFDLIGLPPTPEEVEAFLSDEGPHAFAQVVDRLLDSVHFGERWGRHWLDLVRYAETRGHEFEPIIPNAWQYRDYVIRALNADVPYDRFLSEQIAGDLLEPRWRVAADKSPPALPIDESLTGTGFWFLGEEVHSPVDIRKDEADRMDNRLDVLSKTFLGLTVACARCHDHKFDAISQRDYYALAGFAISSSYRQIRVDTAEQHRQIAAKLDRLRTSSRREMAKAIVDATRPVFDKLDRYWLVAMQSFDEGFTLASQDTPDKPQNDETTRIVNRLASQNSLDPALLSRWCAELNSAKNDSQHPLHGIFVKRETDPINNTNQPTGAATPQATVVADFGKPDQFPPMQDGVSFGLRPVEPGRLVIDGTADAPKARVTTIGGWERDLFWKKLSLVHGTEVDAGVLGSWQPYGRMVRTPEFALTSRQVWYLVRGSVRAYADVNSHLIVMGPLHGALLREFKHDDDQWHWVSHGLDLYQGHRMHVEFFPLDEKPCDVAMVVQSDEPPKLPETNWQWLFESAPRTATTAERAASAQKAFRDASQLIEREANKSSDGESASSKSNATPPISAAVKLVELADWFVKRPQLFSLAGINYSTAAAREAESELAKQVQWESTLAPAIFDGNGVDEFLLVRGNSITPKEPIPRRFLEAFDRSAKREAQSTTASLTAADIRESHSLPSEPRVGSGRLGLARDMLRSPLASRVAVNRIWHHLFGRGIVPSVDNFGVLGLPPSHPELLDHLATQFVQSGWSTKSLIRSLVLSRTYQMASHPTEADSLDPNNELWHRMPMKRLEGEAIRDSLLAVSGRLDKTSFGPSVAIHLTEFMQGRGRPDSSGPLDGNGRRTIYISVRRNFLSPMMLAFDTPNPFSTMGRRTISNVPAQALILMNDPFVIEQAKLMADRLLSDSTQTIQQRIDRLYLTAFARHPTSSEISEASAFVNAQGAASPENQRDAWSNLCHVIFNVKEFVFIE